MVKIEGEIILFISVFLNSDLSSRLDNLLLSANFMLENEADASADDLAANDSFFSEIFLNLDSSAIWLLSLIKGIRMGIVAVIWFWLDN